MPKKLNAGQKHTLKLIKRGADAEGWAIVSISLFPIIAKKMPSELVTLEKTGKEGGGRVRLTDLGASVVTAIDWL